MRSAFRQGWQGFSRIGVDEEEDFEKIKIGQLTNVFGLILAAYALVIGVLVLGDGRILLGLFDVVVAFLVVLSIFLFKYHRRVNLAANTLVFLFSLFFLYLQGYGGWTGMGVLWLVLYPLAILPLKGAGKGTLVCLLMLAASSLLYIFRHELGLYSYQAHFGLSGVLYKRMVLMYLGAFSVSFSYVRNRHSLYEEIKRLSLTDLLTHLPNRRHINSMLERESSLFHRRLFGKLTGDQNGRIIPFSCLLCDIDDFKKINDKYGHLNGDVILRQFSALLQETLRASDFVGRWGGEEFLIILEETDFTRACFVAKKILEAVRERRFTLQDGQGIHFTISCGVGCYSEKHTLEDFIRELDNNLYYVKNNGKDGAAAGGVWIK